MCRGYRRMYYETGLPGWMRHDYPGPRGQRGLGRGRHGPAPWDWGWEPYREGPWGIPPSAEEERQMLKDQAEALRRQLEGIERRIADLEPSEA